MTKNLILFGFGLFGILLSNSVVQSRKYGKEIGNFNSYAHKVSGQVFVVDEDTIFIKNFTYDGLGPDAYFWIGTSSQPSPSGTIVPYPDDYNEKEPPVLTNFDREDVILNLPSGYKVHDLKWLSVWCRRFTVNFGDIYIPRNIEPPRRKILPEFKRLAHGLKSGNITILDAKTFYIPNLYYDGAGPDAYFWVGKGDKPDTRGKKIPDEKGTYNVLKGYQGEDIELTLPGDMTVYDIDYLGVWCVAYRHNFGHVNIPKNLEVPPNLAEFKSKPKPNKNIPSSPSNGGGMLSNCREFLNGNIQLQWEKEINDRIKFKISGRIAENQYIGLGFSPVKGQTVMVEADAVIAYYLPDSRKQYYAVDYFLDAKSQCDGRNGACPDIRIGGSDDITVLSGARRDGITSVTFTRPIRGSDSQSRIKLDMDLEDNSNIFVAIGNLNVRNEVAYHFGERTDGSEDVRISLSTRGDNSCKKGDMLQNDSGPKADKIRPWDPLYLEGVQNFTVRIGPTGGIRGYTTITGNPSWGIAWWVNDLLIPEIYVERGKTYNFIVEGGDDPRNPSKYHPFYITTSDQGGYGQKSAYEQTQQTIYAGVAFDTAGYPQPTGVGRYCEWEHKSIDKSKHSQIFCEKSFEEFKKTLKLVCEDGEPGLLTWTVPQDAPNQLYYQCYTHNTLGWKINVVDPGYRLRRTLSGGNKVSSSNHLSIQLVIFYAITYFITSRISN